MNERRNHMSDIDPEFNFPIEEILPATAEPLNPLQQLSVSVRQVFSAYVTGDHYQTSAAILRVLQQLNELPLLGGMKPSVWPWGGRSIRCCASFVSRTTSYRRSMDFRC